TSRYPNPDSIVSSNPAQLGPFPVSAEELLDKADFDTVGRVGLQDLHAPLVGFTASPILLQFEQVLQGGDRDRSGLDEPLHRAFMGLFADVAAGVGGDVDLITGTKQVECREQHTGFRPEPGQYDLVAA